MATKVIDEHLRFAPEVLARLGEELIPRPEQGILELVRNAYDADATTCSIELGRTNARGGFIRVNDDGDGMTADDIRNGWLVVGRSKKSTTRRTSRGRLPVGDKGLGRLAALRMGARAVLETRPKRERGVAYTLTLDWQEFDASPVVEDVPLTVRPAKTSKPPGTTIVLENLHGRLTEKDIDRLARNLVLLSDPFDKSTGFTTQLIAPGFEKLERLVRRAYFDHADFLLRATLDGSGRGSAELIDWRGKAIAHTSKLDTDHPRFRAPAASFELWNFLMDAKTFAARNRRITATREWLKAVGGVYLYHRGLRVFPYGDPGHDWLDMNLARARSPELRPSTNNSVGKVIVSDPKHDLIQKTDRSGFLETESFEELRRFCTAALEWMATQRLRLREETRDRERKTTPKAVRRAKTSLSKALEQVPNRIRPAVEEAVKKLEAARQREIHYLRDDLELYRTLGTVGTTVAVFAHESAKPVTQIEQMAKTVERRGRDRLGESYDATIGKPVAIIQRAAAALRTYAQVPIIMLRRERRKRGRIDVHEALRGTIELFGPFLADAKILLAVDLRANSQSIFGTSAAIDAVVANLLTNAITALTDPDATCTERRVAIRTEDGGENLLLSILDNGPGVRGIPLEDIWLPGRTTKQNGTGLGLTIVRDVVADLGGTVTVTPKGELGGAEFIIAIPLAEVPSDR